MPPSVAGDKENSVFLWSKHNLLSSSSRVPQDGVWRCGGWARVSGQVPRVRGDWAVVSKAPSFRREGESARGGYATGQGRLRGSPPDTREPEHLGTLPYLGFCLSNMCRES